MASFTNAMDSLTRGENGAPELTAKGVGEPLVALFFKLVRGMPEATLHELMAACTKAGSASSYADVVVLAACETEVGNWPGALCEARDLMQASLDVAAGVGAASSPSTSRRIGKGSGSTKPNCMSS